MDNVSVGIKSVNRAYIIIRTKKVNFCTIFRIQISENLLQSARLSIGPKTANGRILCGILSTFRSLRGLLSAFVSTNTTQILQAHKQMKYDNNYLETNNLIFITNMIEIIKIQCSFYLHVCICRKHSYGQFNKK